MLRLLATELVGNVTSRKHSHSWRMYSFQTVWGRCSLRKYCCGKQTHAFISIMVLLGSKIKRGTMPCTMPKQSQIPKEIWAKLFLWATSCGRGSGSISGKVVFEARLARETTQPWSSRSTCLTHFCEMRCLVSVWQMADPYDTWQHNMYLSLANWLLCSQIFLSKAVPNVSKSVIGLVF